jgi:alpha-ribazole phosphatase
MRWVWIRHGETEINAKGCYLGHFDQPLNDMGRMQARQIARQLIHKLNDTSQNLRSQHNHSTDENDIQQSFVLYSSDLSRSMETAQIIWETLSEKMPTRQNMNAPISTPALRELDFGEWDCKTYAEIDRVDPERLHAWYQDPYFISPPNGETLTDLSTRLEAWVEHTLQVESHTQTIVVVSHGGPIRWFQSTKVEKDPSRFWQVRSLSHGGMYIAEWKSDSWIEASL